MTQSTTPAPANPTAALLPATSTPRQRQRRNRPRRGSRWTYVPLVLLALSFTVPLMFMVSSSFKDNDAIFADLDSWRAFFPTGDISTDNYAGAFDRVPVARFFINSAIVTLSIVGVGLVVNSMAGFALSRLQWRGRTTVLVVIIATLIVPFETIAVPMVYWVAKLPWLEWQGDGFLLTEGWLNSYHVQIIPFVANAFSIFLFTQYYKSIPTELDEAARIDGASWFRIYRSIVSPLAGPAFATSAILTFLPTWNSYLWPLMVVQKEDLRPVQLGLAYFFQLNTAWGEVMAYTTLITIPVLFFFLLFQRAFVSSIAATGVKG
jgi:multiple sugar transport system permease protein